MRKQVKVSIKRAQEIFDTKKTDTERKEFFKTHSVSELFIERNISQLNYACWLEISDYQKLSETFISKHEDRVGWMWISQSQELSETFIEKYADKLDWDWISISQKLSVGFILEHLDKLDVDGLKRNKKVNQEDLEEIEFYVLAKLAQSG